MNGIDILIGNAGISPGVSQFDQMNPSAVEHDILRYDHAAHDPFHRLSRSRFIKQFNIILRVS